MSERALDHNVEAPAADLQSLAESEHYAVDDPFAKDLFAAHAPAPASVDGATDEDSTRDDTENSTPNNAPPDTAWVRRLPSVSAAEADSSNALPALPALFARRCLRSVEQIIAATTHVPSSDVSLEIADVREAISDYQAPATAMMKKPTARSVGSDRSSTVRARLTGVTARGARWSATIETDSAFAIALADWILGGDRRLVWDMRRTIDPACLAVIEFLILRVVHHLRSEIDGGHARIEELRVVPHYDPAAEDTDGAEPVSASETRARGRGVIVGLSLSVDDVRGILRCRIPPDALAACANIGGGEASDRYARDYASERLESLTRLLPRLRAAIIVGASELGRDDLAALEPGDTIVLTRVERWIADDADGGGLIVRVGMGDGVLLVGSRIDAAPDAAEDAGERDDTPRADRQIKFKLAEVRGGRSPRDGGATEMDDVQQEEDEEAPLAVAIDNLIVEVHVELPSRRIRLGELADLRVNQIIDLQCSPLDPVELVVDGRAVARGELVDIEGRLGVRITSVGD